MPEDHNEDSLTALIFGSYDETLHPRIAVIRDGLRANGWTVSELNAPLGASTANKVSAAGSVGGAVRLAGQIIRSWWRLIPGRRNTNSPDVVVVGYMGHFDVHLARLLFPGKTIVLDHMVGLADTVRDRGLGSGLKFRLLDALDRAALRAATVVLVDTTLQADMLPAWARGKSVAVPVGATDAWYEAGESNSPSGAGSAPTQTEPVRIVFYGLFTPLQGAPIIGAAISDLSDEPNLSFTMIGTGQDLDTTKSLTANGRVDWIDWVDSEDLPAVVASHDICLGIFGETPKTQRVVPNKVYQGMAAGCAVVSADTPAMRALVPEGSFEAVPTGDHTELARALRTLARNPDQLRELRDRSRKVAATFRPASTTLNLHRILTK